MRLGLLVPVAVAAEPPSRLRIRSIELPGQAQPSVATVRGGFVLTYIERDEDEAHHRFAELDPLGAVVRKGSIASGKNWFVNWADFPSLVETDAGDWVTFHLEKSDPALPYAYDVRLQRSKDRGATWSAPLTVHTDGTPTEHGFVTLLPHGANDVLVAWLDGRHGASMADHDHHQGAHTSLQAAIVADDQSIRLQAELDDLTCDCCNTDGRRISGRVGDTHWLFYRDRTPSEVRDLRMVRFDGKAFTTPAPVLEDNWVMPGCPVNGPAAATLGGRPIVFWPTMRDGQHVVRTARFDRTWSSLGDIEVGEAVQGRVDAVAFGKDEALLSWIGTTDTRTTLKLAHLDAQGRVRSTQVVTDIAPGRNTGMPRLAARGRHAILVWTESGANGARVRGVAIGPLAEETGPDRVGNEE